MCYIPTTITIIGIFTLAASYGSWQDRMSKGTVLNLGLIILESLGFAMKSACVVVQIADCLDTSSVNSECVSSYLAPLLLLSCHCR